MLILATFLLEDVAFSFFFLEDVNFIFTSYLANWIWTGSYHNKSGKV